VDAAGIRPGELVLDIGAGLGALTAPLVRAGAQVVAFELHPGRADRLRRQFADVSVTVVRADATDLRLPARPFRVVSSPPYNISTALLKRLLAPGSRLVSADLVLQRQVANRWARGDAPGANRWFRHYDLSIGIRLPRKAFTPPPHVDSAVLVLRKR
jgi:23S rRNA (adenine-N6)-dimethyltransferase